MRDLGPPPGMVAPMVPKEATVAEAARIWTVSQASVRRWCASGRIAARRHGRAWVIDMTQVPICPTCRRPYFGELNEHRLVVSGRS